MCTVHCDCKICVLASSVCIVQHWTVFVWVYKCEFHLHTEYQALADFNLVLFSMSLSIHSASRSDFLHLCKSHCWTHYLLTLFRFFLPSYVLVRFILFVQLDAKLLFHINFLIWFLLLLLLEFISPQDILYAQYYVQVYTHTCEWMPKFIFLWRFDSFIFFFLNIWAIFSFIQYTKIVTHKTNELNIWQFFTS